MSEYVLKELFHSLVSENMAMENEKQTFTN